MSGSCWVLLSVRETWIEHLRRWRCNLAAGSWSAISALIASRDSLVIGNVITSLQPDRQKIIMKQTQNPAVRISLSYTFYPVSFWADLLHRFNRIFCRCNHQLFDKPSERKSLSRSTFPLTNGSCNNSGSWCLPESTPNTARVTKLTARFDRTAW